eukprot:7451086-Ditylum_brightwellii.AAC.1
MAKSKAREGRVAYREDCAESRGRRYHGTVLSGKLRAAVQAATDREKRGVLFPSNNCTKTGAPVLEVLKGKHLPTRTPDVDDPRCLAFKEYDEVP